jgi:predicted dehydrogenase
VLIDPPLGVTLHGVEMLRYQAQLHSQIVAVGFPDRQYAAFQVLKEALLEQRFGRPLQMVATRGCHVPTELPNYSNTDYALHLRGGGAVQHALSHLINLGEWLLGPVNRLVADADRLALADVTVEDTAHVLARHGRMLAVYALHQHQAVRETCITVNCVGGTVRAQLPENNLKWMTEPNGQWSEQMFDPMEPSAAQIETTQQFLNAIEGLPARLCTLDQGLQTLRVCRAVLASVQQKVWVGGESAE